MKATLCLTGLIMMAALVLACSRTWAADATLPSAMTGHWEGDARVVVSWSQQTTIHVALDIRPDSSVTGKIGDATITNGHFTQNRGRLGRALNWATDYIIQGKLDGAVIAAEGITRESVSIPLNFISDAFVGGVHTSGSKFGGKEKMILSARSLTLRRVE